MKNSTLNNTDKKKNRFKGPVKYLHTQDSPLFLSALRPNNTWVTIYSRERPGSRSNKIFTKAEQIAHLQKGFTSPGEVKGFEGFEGDFKFAYIAERRDGVTWRDSICYWTTEKGWSNGVYVAAQTEKTATAPPPAGTKRTWEFGPNGSTLFLHVKTPAGWLPKIWGWNRQDSYAKDEFPLEEQISRLQGQFATGGHSANRFDPATVIQAFIAYREGGNVQNSICYWTDTGWLDGTQPYLPADAAAENLPVMTGRLWLAMHEAKGFTIRPNNDIRRQFSRFSETFYQVFPKAIDRYVDTETGELPAMVMEAHFWAWMAVQKKINDPAINKARIYFEHKPDHWLVPRMDTGKLYCPKSFAEPLKSYFYEVRG